MPYHVGTRDRWESAKVTIRYEGKLFLIAMVELFLQGQMVRARVGLILILREVRSFSLWASTNVGRVQFPLSKSVGQIEPVAGETLASLQVCLSFLCFLSCKSLTRQLIPRLWKEFLLGSNGCVQGPRLLSDGDAKLALGIWLLAARRDRPQGLWRLHASRDCHCG